MVGNGGAQRRQARRLAVLGQARAAAMGQIALQQAAPGFQRKQIRAVAAREEIVQQSMVDTVQRAWRASISERRRHQRSQGAILRARHRGQRCGFARQLLHHVNARRGTRLD